MEGAPTDTPPAGGKSLPKRFRRNVISNYMSTATKAVIALAMTPVLVNGLGTEAFGIWTLVGSMIFYLELLEFGFGNTAMRAVAEREAVGDRQGVKSVLATAFWLLVLPAFGALAIGVVIAQVFPELFEVSGELSTEAQILIIIVALDLAISIPSDTFGGALIGLQRFDLLNATVITVAVAQAIGWTIVIVAGGGLVALGIVTIVLSLIGQLARYVIVRRLLPEAGVSLRNVDRSLLRPFAGQSFWFSVTEFGEIIRTRIDVIVVGLVVSVSGAGIYGVAQKLTVAVIEMVDPVTRLFFPHSASLAARDERAALHASLLTGTRITLAIAAPLCIMLATLAPQILSVWVGSGFDEAADVTVYLASAIALSTVFRTGLWMLLGARKVAGPAALMIGEALLNLALSVWLGSSLGLDGVALGTLIATAVTATVAIPFMCRQFEMPTSRFLAVLLRAHLPPIATALAVGWLVTRLPLTNLPAVIAAMIAVAGSYVLVFALSGLAPDERRAVRERIRPARSTPVSSRP